MPDNLRHPLNAFSPIQSKSSGIIIFVNSVHPENVDFPIFTPLEIITLANLVQLAKTESPICTPSGIVISVKVVFAKAEFPIWVKPSGRVTLFKFVQY